MTMRVDTSLDGTVSFTPERLNRDPVVLRGLTNDEMFLMIGMGAGSGLLIGLLVWALTGEPAMVPSCLFAITAFTLMTGGSVLRKAKRNRPETWFYRYIQWLITRRTGFSVGEPLITRSGYWSVRRERRST